MIKRIILIACFCILSTETLLGQVTNRAEKGNERWIPRGLGKKLDREDAEVLSGKFALNRDQFSSYCVASYHEIEYVETFEEGTSNTTYRNELDIHKSEQELRRDSHVVVLGGKGNRPPHWDTRGIREKVPYEFSLDGELFSGDQMRRASKYPIGRMEFDPWSLCVSPRGVLSESDADREYPLAHVFNADRFVAGEEGPRYIVTDWTFAAFMPTRLQVVFDKQSGDMPVYCRYYIPKAESQPQEDLNYQGYFSECTTKWKEIQDGRWVPIYWELAYERGERGEILATTHWRIELSWKDIESLPAKWQDPTKVDSESLWTTVRGTRRTAQLIKP